MNCFLIASLALLFVMALIVLFTFSLKAGSPSEAAWFCEYRIDSIKSWKYSTLHWSLFEWLKPDRMLMSEMSCGPDVGAELAKMVDLPNVPEMADSKRG